MKDIPTHKIAVVLILECGIKECALHTNNLHTHSQSFLHFLSSTSMNFFYFTLRSFSIVATATGFPAHNVVISIVECDINGYNDHLNTASLLELFFTFIHFCK